jgi:predicted DNA-binding transcriptional regulator AlpA
MLTVKQFADKIGKSRQRVHQLMLEGRIFPRPKRVGYYYLVAANARVTQRLTTSK